MEFSGCRYGDFVDCFNCDGLEKKWNADHFDNTLIKNVKHLLENHISLFLNRLIVMIIQL